MTSLKNAAKNLAKTNRPTAKRIDNGMYLYRGHIIERVECQKTIMNYREDRIVNCVRWEIGTADSANEMVDLLGHAERLIDARFLVDTWLDSGKQLSTFADQCRVG